MLDPRAFVPTAWRNGLGSTRELAADTGVDGSVVWRISVAILERDVEFSAFPGMDRVFVALGPLHLTVDGVVRALDVGEQASFAGEADVSVALRQPTRALNVMVRRGSCRAEVGVRRPTEPQRRGTTHTVDLETLVADVIVHPEQEFS